jgi:hypothetical protein
MSGQNGLDRRRSNGFLVPDATLMRRDRGQFDGVWALERGQCPNESSPKLDAVATQPDTSTLDQPGERLA